MSDNGGQRNDDASIISRAVAAYRRDDKDLSKPSGMWEHTFDMFHIPTRSTYRDDYVAIQRLFRVPSESQPVLRFRWIVR
jgi:hypothetical protein